MKQIFGYGSLINTESRLVTIPTALDARPAYIKGFIRDFSVWDAIGFRDGKYKDIGFRALNVTQTEMSADRVNGAVFPVDETLFNELLFREKEYGLITVPAYDYESDAYLGEVEIFSAPRMVTGVSEISEVELYYLQLCVDGAQAFGNRFYEEFLETTSVNGRSLREELAQGPRSFKIHSAGASTRNRT
ncbi:MAG: hypothetical protein QOE22_504 [Candidatus Parcubacteria bacterium]|nr:hypothetical protein [Candidatus Parcubacteria bacterium]